MFCTSCGQAVPDGSRFCASCGAGLLPSAAAAPTPVTRVIVVEPKRAGRLALKGFLLSFGIYIVGAFAHHKPEDVSVIMLWMILGFGIGTAYIVVVLRGWERQKSLIRGAWIAWTMVGCFALIILGAVMGSVVRSGSAQGTGSASASADAESVAIANADPKAILLRDVELKYSWSKEGFGNVMIASFTLKNPTYYRFKDFEITCTHYAASGTHIDSNTRTVYEIVEPHSTKQIKGMNMGFIHSQAATSSCQVSDLVVLQ
jgi:zinc-ribbon domain